jgi:MFS family permease
MNASTAPNRAPRWGALAYSQFRLYWAAQIFRVLGLQFRIFALPWLVSVELDKSPIWLSAVALAASLPTILLSVPAGLLADRFNDQKLIVYSNGTYAVLAMILPFLIFADLANIWIVIAWALLTGIVSALGNPALNSMMPRLIDMRVMPSAVALNSMVWSSMRIVGPAAAGVLLAWIGTGQAFFVTAVGIGIATGLMAMLHPRPRALAGHGAPGDGLWSGVQYIAHEPLFLATIGLSFFTSVFGSSYQFLLPVFADDILNVGAQGFGLMEAAAGVGSVLGTIAIVRVGSGPYAGRIMIASAAMFGLLIAAFAASRAMPLSLSLLFLSGLVSAMYLNIGMTTLQVKVPDELRGRVMGVWSMTWFLASVGSLPAGLLAEWLGAAWSVALGGLSVTAFGLVIFALAPELRQLDTTRPEATSLAVS